jgi:3-hydroxybutyryl-CoA dehydrogenase
LKIENVAIIGAGTMGHALALVHALGGCNVRLQDVSTETLEKAPGLIDAACQNLVDAGEVTNNAAQTAIKGIHFTSNLSDALTDTDLIVEAIVEKEDIKRTLFAQIDAIAPANATIASNTSYLDIFPLVPTSRQKNTLIAHWYTPPYIIDLVDIAAGPETSPIVISAINDLYVGFGKKPLLFKRLIPGYIANRLQAALNLECLRMIDEGWVSASDIDHSVRHGIASRLAILGHMKKMDYTDLRMSRNGIASRMYLPPENTGGSATLTRLIDEGRTGVRAGAGFYDYGDASPEDLFKARDTKLLKLKQAIKIIEKDD